MANDEAIIEALTEMETTSSETNDVGIGILNNLADTLLNDYQFTSNSGTQDLVFGDQVRLASDFAGTGTPGAVYRFMGDTKAGAILDGVSPGTEVYDPNLGFWQQLDETNVIPNGIFKALRTAFGLKGGTSKSFYALVVWNDVEGEVEAFIDDSTVNADGNISVTATEAARITATENSTVSAVSSSTAKGGVISNNQVLANANAFIIDSEITTTSGLGGDVIVDAQNVAQINATMTTKTQADTAVSVAVAFNALGWDASNIFFNAFDTLLGTELLIDEQPVEAQAFIRYSDVSADGDVSVTASTNEMLFDLDPQFAIDAPLLIDNAAQGLDDAGDIDFDDDNDEADDAAFLEALRDVFAENELILTGDLFVTTLAVDNEWFLDDTEGSIYTIKREGTALKVSRGSILNAQAGNETTSNATNDRVLVDAFVTANKPENSGKGFKKLKFGSNGIAAGGILATNRASSLTIAFIDETGFDFTSSDIADALLPGDRVQLANGDIFEYVGGPQLAPVDFDFLTLTQPDEIVSGDRVRLTSDTGGGTAGQIYEYSGSTLTPDFNAVTEDHVTMTTPTDLARGDLVRIDAAATDADVVIGEVYEYLGDGESNGFEHQSSDGLTDVVTGDRVLLEASIGGGTAGDIYSYLGEDMEDLDFTTQDYTDTDLWELQPAFDLATQNYSNSTDWRRLGVDLFAQDFTSNDWTLINAPLSIDLGSQDFNDDTQWELITADIAGTVEAGGNITVDADDSIAILADSEIDISAVVTNNLAAFTTLADNVLQRDYSFTTQSGLQFVNTDDQIFTHDTFDGDGSNNNIVYQYTGAGQFIDLSSLTQTDIDNGPWDRLTGQTDISDIFPDVGNLAESNSRATGGLIVFNDVRGDVEGFINNTIVDTGGDVTVQAIENATLLSTADSNVTSSGGSAWGTGASVAINGQIISNVVLSKAKRIYHRQHNRSQCPDRRESHC